MSAVAYFVSAHGFGHAARASAVMTALRRRRPETALHVFTTVPRWFFDDSVGGPLAYHPLRTDVGLVQRDPFVEDLPATVAALEDYWGSIVSAAAAVATTLGRLGVDLVAADISPLGLVAAEAAGLPSVLVENFTWDWIYRGYVEEEPRLGEFAQRHEKVLARVDRWIQARPVCRPRSGATAVSPVGRGARASREEVRRVLGLNRDDPRPLVMMTMGGMGWRAEASADLAADAFFVTLGGVDAVRRRPGLLALPDRSPIFPPDLVAAADLVVAKLGYSTVAECFRGGSRLLFLERPRFRESDVLADFCRRELGAVPLDPASLRTGDWLAELPAILSRPAPAAGQTDGAEQVARLLAERLT